MSGRDGARGYLLQAMICVLDSLTDDNDWTSVTIEPKCDSEKVDIAWTFPSSRKVVQVKHSTNRIGLPQAKKWAKELEDSVRADLYELRLLGPIAGNLRVAGGMIGRVAVPIPEVPNIPALRRQAAHNLDLYVTGSDPPVQLRPKLRELLVDALCNRLGALSTDGTTFSRADLDKTLRQWVNEILLQSGHKPTQESGEKCLDSLKQLLAKSLGRRVARWQAAGLPREIAISLSENETIGALPDGSLPSEASPVRLVVAPLGAGKSLAAERFFQSCVRQAMASLESAIPVFVDASETENGLEVAIRSAAENLGDPAFMGAWFVVDSLDELPAGTAQRLLTEARALVHSWPRCRALLTSRPMRCWEGVEELAEVPRLSEADSLKLVALSSTMSESDVKQRSWGWNPSIKQTITIPLFAILLGKCIKEGYETARLSRAQLIANLAERAIAGASAESQAVNEACRQLATRCLDRGGGVPSTEIQPRRLVDELLQEGLVVESSGFLRFSLPILTQWFGAQALVEGDVPAESLWSYAGRIDRWRSPIAIAVGTGSESTVERILTPIAKRDPGYLQCLVEDATTNWNIDTGGTPPNALEAAQRIRSAMEACIEGIGRIAQLVAPINRQTGRLFSTAARTDREWLLAGWSIKADDADVCLLPSQIGLPAPWKVGDKPLPGPETMSQFTYPFVRPYWISVRGARPGSQSAWAWRWVGEHLQTALKERIAAPSVFDQCALQLMAEGAWHSAVELLKLNRFYREPIPFKAIENELLIGVEELKGRSSQQFIWHRGSKYLDLTLLVLEWLRLDASGIAELVPPLPASDLPEDEIRKTTFIWQWFSRKQQLVRIKAVIESAVAAYDQIVQQWFRPMAERLRHAATLPASVLVEVDTKEGQLGLLSDPLLRMRWEPLPSGYASKVVVEEARIEPWALDARECSRLHEQLIQLRPALAESLGTAITVQRSHGMFDNFAIRELTYKWLEDDLRRIKWLG